MKDLLIAFRRLRKNLASILVHVLSVAIAIGCFVVSFFSYHFLYTFDRDQSKGSQIYRLNSVTEFQGTEKSNSYAPMPLRDLIKQNIGYVNNTVRFSFFKSSFRLRSDFFAANLAYADPEFFNIFSFNFLEGSPNALTEKYKIIITDQLAQKYFGKVNVVGEKLERVLLNSEIKEYEVVGVYKTPPTNSSFDFEACINYTNMWEEVPEYREGTEWKAQSAIFIELRDDSRVLQVENLISEYADLNNNVRNDFIIKRFELHRFEGMALRDRTNKIRPLFTRQAPPIGLFIGTVLISLFIFLLTCFNWINGIIIEFIPRINEIGIRKALGCSKFQLIKGFVIETSILVLLSFLTGFIIAYLFLIPFFNDLWPDFKIIVDLSAKFIIYLLLIFIVTVFLIGSYPLLYINKFASVNVFLKNYLKTKSQLLPRILLMIQFIISLAAVIVSTTLIKNAKFQKEIDLGFEAKGGIYAWVNNNKEYEVYKNALLGNKDITSVTFSKDHLFISSYKNPIKHNDQELEVKIMDVGDDYLKTVGLTLIEGRDFRNDSETDKRESIIISSSLVRKLGIEDPIGQEIVWRDSVKLKIIGIVKDIYNNGLWRESDPMMLRYVSIGNYPFVIVRTSSNTANNVSEFMEKKWKELFPNRFYPGRSLNAEIYKAEVMNSNLMKMFLFLGSISIVITTIGLFNLVAKHIVVRMKEIGIRKVLGATHKNILWEIGRSYFFIILAAVLIGTFLSNYLTEMLMRSFWYFYQPINFEILLVSGLLFILISLLAIVFKVNQAAKTNVAEVLRSE